MGDHEEQADRAEAWRSLRLGDRIRIVRMPSGVDEPGYTFHPDTRRLYERLIERGRALRISEIDEWGTPWISCRFQDPDGTWVWHYLEVTDDSWVRVRRRSG